MDTVAGQRNYRKLFWFLAIFGLALDLATKYGIFAWLFVGPNFRKEYPLITDVFKLEASYTSNLIDETQRLARLQSISAPYMPFVNHGALFGIGQDANLFFAVVSFLAATGIIIWSCRSAARSQGFLCLSLGLILGGTLGNFYDRIVFHGVRDFLHWHAVIDWPVFNIADCFLVCGAGLLMIEAFFRKEENADEAPKPASDALQASPSGEVLRTPGI